MRVQLNLQTGNLVQQLQATRRHVAQLQSQLNANWAVAKAQAAFTANPNPASHIALQRALLRQQSVGLQAQLAAMGGGVSGGHGGGGFFITALARAGGAGRWSAAIGQFASKLGPVGAAFTALIGAMAIYIGLLFKASEILKTWSDTYWKSGARQQGAQSIAAIASALGMDASAVAAKAGSMPGGSAQFLQYMRAIMGATNDQQAFYLARSLGMEDYLGLRDLDKKQQAEVMSGEGFGYSAADRRTNAQFMFEWGKAVNQVKRAVVEGFLPALKALQPILQIATKLIIAFGKAIEWSMKNSIVGGIARWWTKTHEVADKQARATDKFKDAVNEFTKAVGAFGGLNPERVGGAFPQAWAWYGNQQAMMNDVRYLGAFTS